MPVYLCPKHDIRFDSTTDHRAPGSLKKDTMAAHPDNGHPDCPRCQDDAKAKPAASKPQAPAAGNTRRIA